MLIEINKVIYIIKKKTMLKVHENIAFSIIICQQQFDIQYIEITIYIYIYILCNAEISIALDTENYPPFRYIYSFVVFQFSIIIIKRNG